MKNLKLRGFFSFICAVLVVLSDGLVHSSDDAGPLFSEFLVGGNVGVNDGDALKKKARGACNFLVSTGLKGGIHDASCEILSETVNGRAICYKIKTLQIDDYRIDSKPLRLFVLYHYRKDGVRPYYKDCAFKKTWLEEKWSSLNPQLPGALGDCYLVSAASVLDENNRASLYIVDRNYKRLQYSVRKLRLLFDLYESEEEELTSRLCESLEKLSVDSPSDAVSIARVDNTLKKLKKLKEVQVEEDDDL